MNIYGQVSQKADANVNDYSWKMPILPVDNVDEDYSEDFKCYLEK